MGPVRVGNQAVHQTQNDVYGSVVLAAAQMFVDERLPAMGDESLFRMLETLGERALAARVRAGRGLCGNIGPASVRTPIRRRCAGWPATGSPGSRGGSDLATAPPTGRRARRRCERRFSAEAWDETQGALTGAFGEPALDASVLLVAKLGLLPPSDPRFVKTCEAIGRTLDAQGPDHALHRARRFRAARDRVSRLQLLVHRRPRFDRPGGRSAENCSRRFSLNRNAFGLLSEDIHPETGQLWGNLPQTYSMAGIINTATRLSSSWEEAWARA